MFCWKRDVWHHVLQCFALFVGDPGIVLKLVFTHGLQGNHFHDVPALSCVGTGGTFQNNARHEGQAKSVYGRDCWNCCRIDKSTGFLLPHFFATETLYTNPWRAICCGQFRTIEDGRFPSQGAFALQPVQCLGGSRPLGPPTRVGSCGVV